MRMKKLILLILFFITLFFPVLNSLQDCVGTDVDPCHCCDVNAISVTITSPSGTYSQTYELVYSYESGTCGTTPEVTEVWEKNIGYSFCPEEGTYTAVETVSAAGGDQTCSEYANEVSSSFTLYTVNYDSGTDADKWCVCKGGTWFSSYTDGINPQCCGDDGNDDMFENAGTENSACIKGEVVPHNTASSDGRYITYNGEIFYCKEAGGSGSGYSFIQDVNPGSSVGVCKCRQDGKWECGAVVMIRGGRIRIVS